LPREARKRFMEARKKKERSMSDKSVKISLESRKVPVPSTKTRASLRRSPLVGADLNMERPAVAGRKVDL